MILFDIHTHNTEADPEQAILDCPQYEAGRKISLGIHPWYIDNDWIDEFRQLEQAAGKANVVAIGECGMDRMKSAADILLQREVFRAHALLAERKQKPLIIHCVKAFDDILAIHKEITPEQTWIIHGFRGKPRLAEQLTKAGMCLSLGEHFNAESARIIPAERLFIESDESNLTIGEIYRRIASARGTSIEVLAAQTYSNSRIFKQF